MLCDAQLAVTQIGKGKCPGTVSQVSVRGGKVRGDLSRVNCPVAEICGRKLSGRRLRGNVWMGTCMITSLCVQWLICACTHTHTEAAFDCIILVAQPAEL